MAGIALALGIALGASGAADAARYGVRVVDPGGTPVVGASVCIGLEGNYGQFGTAFTDLEGRIEFVEVPNVPIVVTISKTRFAGLRKSEPARGYDIVRELTLMEGVPGPRCRAGSSVVANPPVIDVRDVAVLDEGAVTSLIPSATGEPSEYRIARDDDFAGADWRRFDTTIALPSALADARSVALQLRRHAGDSRDWVEARSSVVTVVLGNRERADEIGSDS